jgi:uncharacterized membrane protein
MRPFAFFLGVVAGSALAIAVCLAMVLTVFLLLHSAHPEFSDELPSLAAFTGLFAVMAGLGLVSLVAQLRNRAWRWWAISGLGAWTLVVLAAVRFWIAGR